MFGRTSGRTSIRGRLGAALGASVLLASMLGAFAPAVLAAGPLTITNVDSPDPVQSGSQIVYTVVVTNTGGAKVNNVHLTDQINGVVGLGNPPLLDVTSSQGACSQTNTQITCDAVSVNGGGTWTVTIRGIVTAAANTTINNIATVVATKSAQTYTTSASATTQVQGSGPGGPSPDLTIGKNGPLQVTPGNGIIYTLTVNNLGNGNALGVKVTDTLPPGVTITSVDATSLFACPPPWTGNTVVCTGGRVNAGANATITVNGTVGPAVAGDLENTSVVDPDNTIDEGILGNTADAAELNNFSNTVVTHVSPVPPPATTAVFLDKTGPATAIPNQLIQYTLKVTNGTIGRADYITLTDGTQGLQAASLRVVSKTATSGTAPICTVAAPTVTCTMTRLSASTSSVPQTLTVVIEGMVVASAGSTIINSAAVNANIKNTGYTARDEVQTIINAGRDLTISKTGTPDPVCARSFPNFGTTDCRGGLKYTFVVGNSGVQVANNVIVRDPLPADTTFDSTASDPRCGVAAGIVTCTILSLAGGASDTIVIVLVAPASLATITNTVTVDPSNAIFESDETNNIAVATTAMTTGINLTISKTDAPPGFDPIATSGTQTYRITVDNPGTQDASGIRVRDTLPAGTTFLSVTADNGFTCSYAAGIVECIGGSIHGTYDELYLGHPADDATIIIKLFAMPNVGTMHNEARVDPLNEIAEYNENDNIAFQDTVVGTGNADKGAFNQLKVTKTQTSPLNPVATNGTLIYNLHVENLGTDPVSAIVVKDFLPAGTRFIEARDTDLGPGLSDAFFCIHDGSATGGVITCSGGALSGTVAKIPEDGAPGDVPTSRDITVKVFAPNTPGTYTNLAKVDPDNVIPEGNEFDNASSINTTVAVGGNALFNELTITKTQSAPVSNVVATSSIVTYQIVVANAGTDPAFNIKVTDTLPAGFSFISAVDTVVGPDAFKFVCVPGAGNTIDCTGATLSGNPNAAPGEPTSRTIEVKATSSAVPGNYINTAIVDPANAIPEGNETNNTAQAPTKVVVGNGFIDLQVSKTGPGNVRPGDTITYTLTVTNAGSDPAFNVKVRDDVPNHTTFVSAVDTTAIGAGAFSCSLVGASILCTGGTLDGTANVIPGPPDVPDTRTIEIKVLAPMSIEAFATDKSKVSMDIFNRAFVDPDNAISESNETNNASDLVKTTVNPHLNLTITKDGPTTATQNDTGDYVIKVTNEKIQDDGTVGGIGATAFGVRVIDPLPVGLIPLSVKADPGNFQCAILENPVNFVDCHGDITAGGVVTITVHVFVTADGGTLDNEACVDPDHTVTESNELDNCNHKITDVVPLAPDLLINKSADSSVVTSGQTLTYTVAVSNVGNASTTDGAVEFTDTLPAEVTFVQASATNGFTCTHDGSPTGGVVTCTGGDLDTGASTHATIQVTVNDGVLTPFKNKAQITSSAAGETNTANNGPVFLTTSVGASGIDLAIASITDTPDPVNTRPSQLTYTIIALNNGTAPAVGAIVRVSLPQTGITITGVAGSNGFNCAANLTIDPSGHTYDCVGDFPAGGNTIITAIMTVNANAPNDLVLTATVDPDNAFGESDESNNSKTETTTVAGDVCTGSPCVDLVVAQVLDNPDPAKAPGPITYTISIVNVGDAPVNPIAIWDIHLLFSGAGTMAVTAPAGMTCTNFPLLSPDSRHQHCISTAGTDPMDLAPGAGLVLTATVTGVAPGTDSLNVTADVFGAIPEFSETNNAVTETTTVIP